MKSEDVLVLVVELQSHGSGLLQSKLASLGYSVKSANGGSQAVARLRYSPGEISAVIVDAAQPATDELEVIQHIRHIDQKIPIILISNRIASPQAAMKDPVSGLLLQRVSPEDLGKALSEAGLPPKKSSHRIAAGPAGAFIGKSAAMAAIDAILPQIAWSDAPVLIQGETGSGKEVIARALHANSQRAAMPFFKLNCAALPSELVESELFGYERGAFTGAFQRKPGIFESADGGTILLDEIGDMDVRLQAKLLQVLQDHSFQRIGGKDVIEVDVRVIAATHRDLEKAIIEGNFREDLYYRLNVVNIVVPPLRERKEDLFELTEVLVKKHLKPGEPMPSLTSEVCDAMMAWDWPGNVRELENFARKLIIFRNCGHLTRELRERMARRSPATALRTSPADASGTVENRVPDTPPLLLSMEEVTRAERQAQTETILHALNTVRWNRKRAAALLQMDYKAMLYKMKKLGIDAGDRGEASVDEMDAGDNNRSHGELIGHVSELPKAATAGAA